MLCCIVLPRYKGYVYICVIVNIKFKTVWLHIQKSGVVLKSLWIICVIYVLCLPCFRVCSLLPCGHLLGKG